jgi:hypothetical protein
MFIARRTNPPAAFGGAELYSYVEALVAFRSSERRCSGISTQAINISPLPGVKTIKLFCTASTVGGTSDSSRALLT